MTTDTVRDKTPNTTKTETSHSARAAGAQGDMQEQGFSDAAFRQLQLAHLARTLCVSVAAVWALLQDRRAPA